jgi:hypothetical protein
MRLTWKDGVATILVAAIVVPYVGYLIQGSMPFIQDPTGMAGVGLILGIAAGAVGGWVALRAGVVQRFVTGALALVSLGLGIAALVSEHALEVATREGMLGAFMASIVVLWVIALGRHSRLTAGAATPTSGFRQA